MRVALPHARPNGHETADQVFAITGMCQQPNFLVRQQGNDICRVHLGSAPLGGAGEDPYLLLRRPTDGGSAIAVVRVEWEGVFTVLSNDDAAAEALYQELLVPAQPEEVQRQWTGDAATLDQFRLWISVP